MILYLIIYNIIILFLVQIFKTFLLLLFFFKYYSFYDI